MPVLDIKTIFILLILVDGTLALAVGWMATEARDGLRVLAAALGVHAVGYLFLVLRGDIPDFVSIICGNTAIAVAYSLFLLAIRRFLNRPCPLWLLIAPPLVVAAGAALSLDSFPQRTVIANGVFVLQRLMSARDLLRERLGSSMRGRNLVLLGLGISSALLVARVGATILRPQDLAAIFQPSAVQQISFLLLFLSLLLVANGFLMMTKERSDDQLRQAARRDHLTGCWNRVHIEEVVAQELAQLNRYGHPIAALLVDIDWFKAINDRHGHDRGDSVLREFSEVVRASLRGTDVLCRWGGEEFLVILPMTGLAEAIGLAERLRREVADHAFSIGERVSVSIGVAACLSADTWENWFHRVDAALYRAKTSGRNQTRADGVAFVMPPESGESAWIYQLVWRRAYLSGSAEIDTQHRELYDAANGLLRLGAVGRSNPEIVAAIEDFLAKTRKHFRDEERIIAAAGFSETEEHVRIHAELNSRAEDLLSLYRVGRVDAATIFHFVIHELFAGHILLDDHTFVSVFEGNVDRSP